MKRIPTATPRKPSARSGPADPLRSSLRSGALSGAEDYARAPLSRSLVGPGFPEPASPFHSSRQHRSPALPLVGRRDGLPAGRLPSRQEACRSPDGERPGRFGGVNLERLRGASAPRAFDVFASVIAAKSTTSPVTQYFVCTDHPVLLTPKTRRRTTGPGILVGRRCRCCRPPGGRGRRSFPGPRGGRRGRQWGGRRGRR